MNSRGAIAASVPVANSHPHAGYHDANGWWYVPDDLGFAAGALAINRRGDLVGWDQDATLQSLPTWWKKSKNHTTRHTLSLSYPSPYGTAEGIADDGTNTYAQAINDKDQIAGVSEDGQRYRLFRYSQGQLTDLDPLIDDTTGWSWGAHQPTAIANDGTIYGNGMLNGVEHTFELVPIPQ